MANFDQQNQNVSKQVNISKADKVYLSEEPPPRKPSFTAPPPPPHFVNRLAEFEAVVEMLLAQQTVETHSRRVALTTAIQGGGGFGKTTLAMAVCHDERVKQHFSDGIVWLSVGQTPNRVALLNDLFKLFETKPPSFSDINLAAAHWRDLVREKRVLLVLDDVWSDLKVRSFLPDSPTCTTLLTTRLQEVVNRTQAQTLTVNEMSTEQAARLLVNWLSEEPEPADWQLLEDLARLLGEWPLMLELVVPTLRAQVADGDSLSEAIIDIRRRLKRKGFTYFDRTDEQARNRAISISIEVSLEYLDHRFAAGRTRYLELATFPEDTDIPFQTVYRLWQATAELDDLDMEDVLTAMRNLNLFVQYKPKQTFRLHDVMRHYLLDQHNAANLRNLHATFLNAYRATLTHWAELPPDEPYLWDHLAYHLIAAQQAEELLTTVKDLRYLAAKSHARTPYAVEADLRVGTEKFPEDDQLNRLYLNFAKATHLLNLCDTLSELQATLYSRLCHISEVADLVQSWRASLNRPYFNSRLQLPDLPDPNLIRTFEEHPSYILACAYSPVDKTILSVWDKTLKLWDVETGECIRTFEGHTEVVTACAYRPDGKEILSASWDKTLKLWNKETGECIHTFKGHDKSVAACAYSRDGETILSAAWDKKLKLWDVETGECIHTFEGHDDSVTACAYSPDGKEILSASKDKTLKLWDVKNKECIHTFKGHTDWILACAYSRDGKTILSASRDKTLKLWNEKTGEKSWECRRTFEGHTEEVTACAYSPVDEIILSASNDKMLKLWDVETGECIHTFEGHTDWILACAYSRDGETILSASRDKTLKLWSAKQKNSFEKHANWRGSCAHSPHTRRGGTALCASRDDTLKLWSVRSGKQRPIFEGHTDVVTACAYSRDGKTILSASRDGTLKLWGMSGDLICTFEGHTDVVTACAYSWDGKTILSASRDKTLKLWEVQTGNCLATLAVDGELHDCAWSPNGQDVVAVGSRGIYFLQVVFEVY